MRSTRYDKLVQWAEEAGVDVFENSGAPPAAISPKWAEWAGMPDSVRKLKVQGTYRRGIFGPEVHMNLPEHSPEWLAVGVMAHELGHHIDNEMGEWHNGTEYDRERRASERGFELLTRLGIKPSDAIRSVFNMSMCTYAPRNWGYERLKEDFV